MSPYRIDTGSTCGQTVDVVAHNGTVRIEIEAADHLTTIVVRLEVTEAEALVVALKAAVKDCKKG